MDTVVHFLSSFFFVFICMSAGIVYLCVSALIVYWFSEIPFLWENTQSTLSSLSSMESENI